MNEPTDIEIIEAICQALESFGDSHPLVILKITSAVRSPGRLKAKAAKIEVMARQASQALMSVDPQAAGTLFTLAEFLAFGSEKVGVRLRFSAGIESHPASP